MCRAGAAPVASSSPAKRAHTGPGQLAPSACFTSALHVCRCSLSSNQCSAEVRERRCNLENQCCEEYEHCVSCCQAPQHSNASVLQAVFRGPDRRGAHCSAGLFLP